MTDHRALMRDYRQRITEQLERIEDEEYAAIDAAAELIASRVAEDELVHVYGPGGHSNLAAQEVFFRAGGLVNMNAILDGGTLLSGGALRSMAMERTPGYGALVIRDNRIGEGDLLVLVNAYGINAALIDAAITARERGARRIGVSSRRHADSTAPDHPARHPSGRNLHDLVDVHIDTKVPVGDAVLELPGLTERVAAISTFANAYAMNCLMVTATAKLAQSGIEPTIWRSGNAPNGDERNRTFQDRFRERIRWL